MTKTRWTVPAMAVITLAACGGGDDGAEDASTATAASATLAITSANLPSVAGVAAAAATGGPVMESFATALVGTQLAQTAPCGSGSRTLNLNDLNGNQAVDPGETATIRFDGCLLSGIGTLDGGFAFTLNAPVTSNVDGSVRSIDVTMAFTELSVDTGGLRATANGTLRLASTRTALETGFDMLTAPAYSETVVAGANAYARSLIDYSTRTDLTPTQATTTFKGIVASSALDNHSVALATLTPFVRARSAPYPSAGSATVSGSRGKATVTAIDADQVRIDLDENGDGSLEETRTVLWRSIL